MKIMFLVGVLTLIQSCTNSPSSSATNPANKKTLHTAIANQVSNFYLKDSLQKSVWNFNLMFAQSLYLRSQDTELVGDLAESKELIHPLEMKISIKNGALFHDRRPVRCEDILWSYDDARHSSSPYRGTFEQIKSWKCENGNFHLTLKKPIYGLIEKLLAGIRIYPANAYPTNSTTPIGSGPYKFVSNDQNKSVWMKHSGYRGPLRPWADKIIVHYVPDSRTRFEWLKNQKIDLMVDWPAEMDPLLKAGNKEINVFQYPSSSLLAIGFSLRSPCFSKFENRAAIGSIVAAHHDLLSDFQDSSIFKIATKMTSPKIACDKPRLYYPAGSPIAHYGASILQSLHQSLGIESLAQESSVFFAKLNAGEYELFAVNLPPENEPVALLEYLHSSQFPPQKNRFYFSQPAVDAKLEQLALSVGADKSRKLALSIGESVDKVMPFVPLGFVRQKMVSHKSVIFKKSISDHPWLMMIEAVKKNP